MFSFFASFFFFRGQRETKGFRNRNVYKERERETENGRINRTGLVGKTEKEPRLYIEISEPTFKTTH